MSDKLSRYITVILSPLRHDTREKEVMSVLEHSYHYLSMIFVECDIIFNKKITDINTFFQYHIHIYFL